MGNATAMTRSRRQRIAWIVAIAADALQFAALPAFAPGAFSPVNDVLDVIVSIVMVRLLGWHPALLPALVAELIPGVDLVPSWTAAVGLVAFLRRGEVEAGAPSGPAAPPPASRPASSAEVVVEDAPPPGPARELPPHE